MVEATATVRFDLSGGDEASADDCEEWAIEAEYGFVLACCGAARPSEREVACILPSGASVWSISESSWMAALPKAGGAISYAAGALLDEENACSAGGAISYAVAVENVVMPVPFFFEFVTAAEVAAGCAEAGLSYGDSAAWALEVASPACPGPPARFERVCAEHSLVNLSVCSGPRNLFLGRTEACTGQVGGAFVPATGADDAAVAAAGGASSYAGASCGAISGAVVSTRAVENELECCGAIAYAVGSGCGAISGAVVSALAVENELESCGAISYAVGATLSLGATTAGHFDDTNFCLPPRRR
jgi:hypothetical protein